MLMKVLIPLAAAKPTPCEKAKGELNRQKNRVKRQEQNCVSRVATEKQVCDVSKACVAENEPELLEDPECKQEPFNGFNCSTTDHRLKGTECKSEKTACKKAVGRTRVCNKSVDAIEEKKVAAQNDVDEKCEQDDEDPAPAPEPAPAPAPEEPAVSISQPLADPTEECSKAQHQVKVHTGRVSRQTKNCEDRQPRVDQACGLKDECFAYNLGYYQMLHDACVEKHGREGAAECTSIDYFIKATLCKSEKQACNKETGGHNWCLTKVGTMTEEKIAAEAKAAEVCKTESDEPTEPAKSLNQWLYEIDVLASKLYDNAEVQQCLAYSQRARFVTLGQGFMDAAFEDYCKDDVRPEFDVYVADGTNEELFSKLEAALATAKSLKGEGSEQCFMGVNNDTLEYLRGVLHRCFY